MLIIECDFDTRYQQIAGGHASVSDRALRMRVLHGSTASAPTLIIGTYRPNPSGCKRRTKGAPLHRQEKTKADPSL